MPVLTRAVYSMKLIRDNDAAHVGHERPAAGASAEMFLSISVSAVEPGTSAAQRKWDVCQ